MIKKIFTKKNCIWAAAVILVIAAIIITVNKYNDYKEELNNYNYAVSCVMNKDYDTALEYFYKCSYSFNDTFEWERLIKGHNYYVKGEYSDAYDCVRYIKFKYLTTEQKWFVNKKISKIEYAYKNYNQTQETTTRSTTTTTRFAETTTRYRYTTRKHTTTDSDPYDAKSYGNEEDFYYDHYDDFYDYYDAENYYDEHQD
ncbi:MAG: hypothetical protein Q4C99_07720 [Clostridia bacterium]|nr:hypothetical protein [Clostridia bacterium]